MLTCFKIVIIVTFAIGIQLRLFMGDKKKIYKHYFLNLQQLRYKLWGDSKSFIQLPIDIIQQPSTGGE